MKLVDMLEKERIRFEDIEITPDLIIEENLLNKALFVEIYVRKWLEKCDFLKKVRSVKPNKKRLYLQENGYGSVNLLKGDGILKFEFDDLIEHKSINYIVEVKSQKLNGYSRKIPHVIEAGKKLFGENSGGILIFMPLYKNPMKTKTIKSIKDKFNGDVNFVDLRYTKKDFNRFFQQKGYIIR